jgi:predicted component of type VI protein secretion system
MNVMRKNAMLSAAGLLLTLFALTGRAAPVDLVFVFDNSGSMRRADPGFAARDEARRFLAGLDGEMRAGVIVFDREVKLTAPLGGDQAARGRSLDGVDYRGQLTNSPAAVERALYELKTNGRTDARKAVVFMTDGIVDTGDKAQDAARSTWLRQDLAADAAAHDIRIYGIAFTEAADLLLIQSLATKTGAEYFRANTAAELPVALEKVRGALATLAAPTPEPAPVPEPAPTPAPAPEIPPAPAATTPPPAEATPTPSEEAALAEFAQESGVPVEQLQQELAGEPAIAPAATAPALSEEERASLEQLSKETGIPVEQLEQELTSAQPGQAIVTPPPAARPAEGTPALSLGSIAAAAVGILTLLVGVWLFFRRRGDAPKQTAPAGAPPAVAPAPPAAVPAPASPAAPLPPMGRIPLPDAWLVDVNGLTTEPPRRLTSKPLMVGRIAGSDPDYLDYYVVNKATVGRRHAVIKQKDQGYWLVDQGSVNGTFVNDERVAGERQLRHGDRIKFHKFEFEFQFPEGVNMTVVGTPVGEQTVVASVDQTLAASSPAALAATPAFERTAPMTAAGVAAAVVAASPPAAADDEFFAGGPGFDDLPSGDVTAVDGDLAQLEADRAAFFDASGSQASDAADLATVALNTGSGGAVTDEFDFDEPPTRQPDSVLAGTAPHPVSDPDFDADASAFFDETIAPPPAGVLDDGLDILDITVARDPTLDLPDAGAEEDFATATTVMPVRPLDLDAVPKAPGFDDNTRTVSMGTVRLGDGDDTFEDFLLSDSVDHMPKPPDTPLPATGDDFDLFVDIPPSDNVGDTTNFDGLSVDETVNLDELPTGSASGDFFDGDVTDQLDVIAELDATDEGMTEAQRTLVMSAPQPEAPPDESTVVLPSSPLARKPGGNDEPPAA